MSRSAARRSAEYQRFFSRAPARSEPLQQIWTTFRRGPSGKGGRESDCDHDGHPDDRTGPREGLGGVVAPGAQGATTGRARASTSLNPRERTSSRRARGLSDVLANPGGTPGAARPGFPAPATRTTANPRPGTPPTSGPARAGPAGPAPISVRAWRRRHLRHHVLLARGTDGRDSGRSSPPRTSFSRAGNGRAVVLRDGPDRGAPPRVGRSTPPRGGTAHKTRTRRTPKPLTRSHGQKGPGLFW